MNTTAYLVVEARRAKYRQVNPETGLRPIGSLHVVAVKANCPARLTRDQVAFKVSLDIPIAIFDHPMPTLDITVPESAIERGPIVAKVITPDGDTND